MVSRAGFGSDSKLGRGVRLAALLLLASLLTACAGFLRGAPPDGCAPEFPLKDGWLGGDGASSVDLGDGRSLWFFGDSFVGSPQATDRARAVLLANTVGISECADGTPRMTYRWRGGLEDPRPVFADPAAGIRVWPLGAALLDDRLLVALLRVRTVDPQSPLGFRFEGMDLARIDNWRDDPSFWTVRSVPLTRDPSLVPGAALLVRADDLVLATPWQAPDGDRKLLLARLPHSEALTAEAPRLAFWAGPDRGWRRGTDPSTAHPVAVPIPAELSFFRHTGGYRMVASAAALGAHRIFARTAPDATGPWSAPVPVADLPDVPAHVFCYAGKAHPQYSRADGTILATYACNSFEREALLEDLTLYRPKTLWIATDDPQGEAGADAVSSQNRDARTARSLRDRKRPKAPNPASAHHRGPDPR